jgi:hypothetical protein
MKRRSNVNVHGKKVWFTGLVATLLLILTVIPPVLAQADPQPAQAMWVDPAFTSGLEYCDTFSVDIYINVTAAGMSSGANGMWAWEFKLYWESAYLNCTGYTDHLPDASWDPPNHVAAGAGIEQNYNASHGRIHRAVSALPFVTPFPTPFVGVMSVCTIDFHVISQPPSTPHVGFLALTKNYPFEISMGDDTGKAFAFAITDGEYEVLPLGLPSPELSVQPPNVVDPNLVACQNFTIDVDVLDVVGLYAWEFKFYYRNDVLNATAVVEGSFLNASGSTSFVVNEFNGMFNSTHGLVWVNCSLQAPPPVSGSGTLATISFHVEALGETVLSLRDTILSDQTTTSIPHDVADGYFNNLERVPGDVNGDGIVNILDVLVVVLAFGSMAEDDPSTPWNETRKWNADADLIDDGKINIYDLVVIGINFGKIR